jgi:hypothetical protein
VHTASDSAETFRPNEDHEPRRTRIRPTVSLKNRSWSTKALNAILARCGLTGFLYRRWRNYCICAAWLRLSGYSARLVQPSRAVVAAIDHDGSGILHREAGGCFGSSRQAEHLQYRSGFAVHGLGLHRRARQQRHCDQHGWQMSLAG